MIESVDVLITVKDKFRIGIDIGFYDYEDEEWDTYTIDNVNVLAWQPLPKPYKDNLCDINPFDNDKFGVDKMTREEIIKYGKEQLDVFGGKHAEFIKSVIELLEQEKVGEWIVDENKERKIDK